MTQWSRQQQAIFEEFATGTGHLVVRARAGTGKTTTIVEAMSRASVKRGVLCAFNKSIATELDARLRQPVDGRVEAKTLHALGFGFLRGRRVDGKRGLLLAERAGASRSEAAIVAKLAGLGKALYSTVPSAEGLFDLAISRGIESEECPAQKGARLAREALVLALEDDGTIDFDDMVWLPVVLGFSRPTYDMVVVDECQDMSPVQIALARSLCRGRIVAVGDDRQAIYGFRGADSGSLDRLKSELGAKELGLTTTYRCGSAIVAAAAAIVPDFCAAPDVHVGETRDATREELLDSAQPGDFVLSRLNAPLASLCLALLRAGRRATIAGRDVAGGMIALVSKLAGKASGIEDFSTRLSLWLAKETSRLDALEATGKDVDARRQFLLDQHETIVELSAGLATTEELVSRIQTLYSEPEGESTPKIILFSVHRAKGLEADRVWCLAATFKRGGAEEENLKYVAITRAKRELIWVK